MILVAEANSECYGEHVFLHMLAKAFAVRQLQILLDL